MSDTITLPREVVKEALEALEHYATDETPEGWHAVAAIPALRTALAAEQPKQEPVALAYCPYTTPPSAHFGYVLGNHWLETAYSRVLDGESEVDVLRDCGWVTVDEDRCWDAARLTADNERLRELLKEARDSLGCEYDDAVLNLAERIDAALRREPGDG